MKSVLGSWFYRLIFISVYNEGCFICISKSNLLFNTLIINDLSSTFSLEGKGGAKSSSAFNALQSLGSYISSDECAILTGFYSYTVRVSLGDLIEDILALVFIRPRMVSSLVSLLANKQGA
jgi:hypothetical protein